MGGALALLIRENGEVTTARLAGRATADYPGDGLQRLRHLLGSTMVHGVAIPGPDTLVAWLGDAAFTRAGRVNMVATFVFADAFELPLQTVCGPLVITGGSPTRPAPLSVRRTLMALNRLGLKLAPAMLLPMLRDSVTCTVAGLARKTSWR